MWQLAPALALFFSLLIAAESVVAEAQLPPISASGTATGKVVSDFDSKAALKASQEAIGNRVGEYKFMTPQGQQVSLGDLRGKPLLLSLVYTSCFHTCPTTIQHLAKVVAKAKDALGEESFNVAVLGFDVNNDTPGAMRYFGRKQGINDEGWYLLSTDRPTIDALMQDVGFVYVPSPRGYDHLVQATLIDAEGEIYRQVYGEVFDTQLLVEPMMDLVLNRPSKGQPFLDDLVNRVRFFCTTYDPRRDSYHFDYSLFIGMLIGGSIILSAIWFMISETRKRNRLRRS